MSDPIALFAIATAFTIVTSAPGPANLACATTAASQGRRAGFAIAFGLAIGLSFWGLIAASGLGALMGASQSALFGLKLLGGAYLLWLAWMSARAKSTEVRTRVQSWSIKALVLRGLFLNVSNPKAVFAWMATLSVGLNPEVGGVFLAVLLCSFIGLLNYMIWALAFSHFRAMQVYDKFARRIDLIVAALFAFAGLSLIKNAFGR